MRIDGDARHRDANAAVNNPIGPRPPMPLRWLQLEPQLSFPFVVRAVGVVSIAPMLALELLIDVAGLIQRHGAR